jgi:hypothetical protein
MKEIRLELTKPEILKLIDQMDDFKKVVLLQDSSNKITHRIMGSKNCTVDLEMFEIKIENIANKYGMAKICPCGTLYINADLQVVK